MSLGMQKKRRYRKRAGLTEEQWKELWSEYRSSGEAQPVFCKRRGICYHNFQFWRKLFGNPELPAEKQIMPATSYIQEAESEKMAPIKFSQVEVKRTSEIFHNYSTAEVCFPNGIRLLVQQGADKATLQILFELLK